MLLLGSKVTYNKHRYMVVIRSDSKVVHYQPKTPTLEFVLVQVVAFKTDTPIPPYPWYILQSIPKSSVR